MIKFSLVVVLISNLLEHASLFEENNYNSNGHVSDQCGVTSNNSCPTWFVPDTKGTGTCRCGKSHDIIDCNEGSHTAAVLNCYCVSYDPELEEVVAGACFFNCEPHRKHQFTDGHMILPCSSDELDNQTCRPFKRTGRLCGKCLPGYSPLVYSYNMSCVECPDGSENWWKFILVAFGPLTLFYFFILFFQINAVSSSLHAVLFYSQAISTTAHCRIILFALGEHFPSNHWFIIVAKLLTTIYGVWNLDFFRAFLPNICLSLGTLPTLALDYVGVIYPLILIMITYFLIDLYDRNFRPLILIWKPFLKIFMIFKRKWDFKTSLIDAFATFFLLSFNKVISVSFDLLMPVQVYTAQSSKGSWALYYDGSVDYFCKQHLPYAILALFFLVSFVIIPVLTLLFYQFLYFQKLLNYCPLPWYILHTFADSFQGCFKNGTESGTRDCRWFAGAYFVLRFTLFLVYAFAHQTIYYSVASVVLLVFIILLIKVQPYKQDMAYHTGLNATFLVMIALLYVSITGYNFSCLIAGSNFMNTFCVVIAIIVVAPLLYLTYTAIC